MPIKGLTDNVEPQFPRLGKLRKGGPKGVSGFGKDLDHFRFTSERPEIVEAFEQAYGKAPRVIPQVYLPYPDALQNFPAWREEWAAGGLKHRCDGEICTISRQGAGYIQEAKPCPYAKLPDAQKKCKPVGRLSLILPKLIKAGYVGYVTLETHSKHDLMRITGALKAVGSAPQGVGGVPFELRRYEDIISTPGKGDKRATRKKWLVALVPEPSFVECQLALAREAAYAGMLPPGDPPALAAPQVEDAEFENIPPATPEAVAPATSKSLTYQPTMDDITSAMTAVGPSGAPLGKYGRDVWGAVWNSKIKEGKEPKYTPELKKYALLLWENTDMVVEWRKDQGDGLDEIAKQDAGIEPLPDEEDAIPF